MFCLSTGPSKEAVMRIHERAGHPTTEIYELTDRGLNQVLVVAGWVVRTVAHWWTLVAARPVRAGWHLGRRVTAHRCWPLV